MPGRLAIDFGTSNTVLAVWDDAQKDGIPFQLPDYGCHETLQCTPPLESVPIVPSVVHYAADNRRWVGNQVSAQNLQESERTFRWMKRYIANRSPVKLKIDGKEISHFDAGRDFLSAVLTVAMAELNLRDEEVAFTVPVESYEHYEDWLNGVAEAAGMPKFRLIDEPSAAALGYGAHIQPGQVYMTFDFGGGTLDVAVVLIEEGEAEVARRHCRVLGKAGAELGGMTIDGWLFQEVLRRAGRNDADDEVRKISRLLLRECERAKELLSIQEQAIISVGDLQTTLTRQEFEELLDRHDALARVDQTIRRALNAARERGYAEENIQRVFLVGGSSLILCVQRTVQRIFGREKVLLHRPLDAVVRGAAAFVAGVDFYDHIQHTYAIRHVDPRSGDYAYRSIVPQGTQYPTTEPLARITVKGSYDGQTELGLAIFEIGDRPQAGAQPMELVFDPAGAARVLPVSPDEEERRTYFWINEGSPTFLTANPPARQGEPRFEVTFGIDGNKRLLITVRDLKTNRLTHREHPVVKLT